MSVEPFTAKLYRILSLANPILSSNCFAFQYKIQARLTNVNLENCEFHDWLAGDRDMLSARLKGFAACVGDSHEAGTRSNVICKLRDTPIPISIEILKPAGTNSQRNHMSAHPMCTVRTVALVRPSLRCLRAKKIIPGRSEHGTNLWNGNHDRSESRSSGTP